MEFDKSRVYTALNADELRAGDKVIVANTLKDLKSAVDTALYVYELTDILTESSEDRFFVNDRCYLLAYLVERKENCTNCGAIYTCAFQVREHPELEKCKNWKPKNEPKTEKEDNMWNYEGLPTRQENGVSDRVVVAIEGYNIVDIGYYDYDLEGWFVEGNRYPVPVYAWQAIKPPRVEE